MNPLGHAQMAQNKHREYEAQYGNSFDGNEAGRASDGQLSRHNLLVLALGGASVAGALVSLISLF